MLVGEWLFSSTEVLAFFAAYLVLFIPGQTADGVLEIGHYLFVLMVVFISLGAVIFPIYDGVLAPAGAGAIASFITNKLLRDLCRY